jgi:DNA-directed RNA polymerase specialized sigma24 family protein
MTKEELCIISKSFDKQVKKAIEKIMDANKKAERNYFKDTEKLLYSFPSLRLKYEQDKEDLDNNQVTQKRKSADIVRFSGGGCQVVEEEQYIIDRRKSMERTKREITRIERALETIKDDSKYCIIEFKYFDRMETEKIAEKMECDETTVRRNKNRLVNSLKIILFGADALEC